MSAYDPWRPWASRRSPVYARRVVATSQPLATQAGLAALASGGNAVDAALATAITLTVVEPTSNGLGSDAFALVWDGDALHGYNGSGRSPKAWTADRFAGRSGMPQRGWDSVTVPGAVAAWRDLSERFGRLPFNALFESAIAYATEGFAVSPIIAASWEAQAQAFSEFAPFAATFCPNGRAPRAGEVFRCADQAATLRRIADSGGDDYYHGELAQRIVADANAHGAPWTAEDLAAHDGLWVDPLSVDFGDVRLFELPPNGQGLAALIALGLCDRLGLRDADLAEADRFHLQIEAMKCGFADGHRYIADPESLDLDPARLLDPAYLDARAAAIDRQAAGLPTFGTPTGGTVYLTAADDDGMMVSFIQSNFAGFGSGVVVPGTGIAMQNRAAGFVLEPGHPNRVGPGKRPYHTIIPAFAFRGGRPWLSYGVMGGPMQPQGHLQVLLRMAVEGMDPQAALDAPRWRVEPDGAVWVEPTFDADAVAALEARGHHVRREQPGEFGGGQVIERQPAGGYIAGSDPRKDGQAAGV